jgi:hypothetical protein
LLLTTILLFSYIVKFRYIRKQAAESKAKSHRVVGGDNVVDDAADEDNEKSLSCFYIKKKKQKETQEHEDSPTVVTCELMNIPPNNTVVIAASLEEAYDELNNEYAPLFEDEDNDLDGALKKREELLADAKLHVDEAKAQRKVAKHKCDEAQRTAKLYKDEKIPWTEVVHSFVVDFGQNASLPHCGDNQPGDSYYMSPLKVNNLGIVDCAIQGGELHIYPYHEGLGKKGGNNVASMIMHALESLKLLRGEGEVGK